MFSVDWLVSLPTVYMSDHVRPPVTSHMDQDIYRKSFLGTKHMNKHGGGDWHLTTQHQVSDWAAYLLAFSGFHN